MIDETITFKGINSEAFGLICETIYRPILPPMEPQVVNIPHRSGSIDYGDNKNNTRRIAVYFGYNGDEQVELRTRARKIAAWLYTTEFQRLIIADEPDKYYLARIYEEIDLESFITIGEFQVTFECQPFAYMVAGTDTDDTWEQADYPWLIGLPWNMIESYQFITKTNKLFTFDNPGTKETNFRSPQGSKFNLIITGSFTTLKISLNGKTLNYNQAISNKTLTIDNIEMEVDLNGANKLNAISGDLATFLEVIPGNNTINVSGIGLDIEVTIDFNPMWI